MRNSYPRPQMVRNNWQNLNGTWKFCFDDHNKGMEEKWYLGTKEFEQEIQVPFVYQSQLSGIYDTKRHDVVWYKRSFRVGSEEGKRTLLHFGAVDYQAKIFLNGMQVCEHEGGHTSFSVDITDFLKEGEQILVIRVFDPTEDELIPRGKQIWEEKPKGIWYTGSTGIWQTVWLEAVSQKYIADMKFTTRFEEGKESICCNTVGTARGDELCYEVKFHDEVICEGSVKCHSSNIKFDIDVIQNHIFRTNFHDAGWTWTPEHPNLFDIAFVLKDETGKCLDEVKSYFGFRKVHTENGKVYLNNKPYYQRLVLDQGYWPEGLMTAPEDDDLKRDIELAKEMGFNGCRKHQKTEDPIFLYW